MKRTRLYGVSCHSDIPLFNADTDGGGTPCIQLAEMAAGHRPAITPGDGCEPLTLFIAHGREFDIFTDNPDWGPCRPGQPWCIRVGEVVSFHWHSGANALAYQRHAQGSDALVAFWFAHIVLPMYLAIEHGFDFIHGAGVEVDGGALLFVAPSTGGKSTLGDYFLQQGHPMLSDDKVRTRLRDGQFQAVPSHPYHRPYRRFEDLGQRMTHYCDGPRLIRAFYCLQVGGAGSDIQFTEVTGFEKFQLLSPNYLYPLRFLQEARLRHLGSMLHATPVYRLTRPWGEEFMHDVYQAVLAHAPPQIDTPGKSS